MNSDRPRPPDVWRAIDVYIANAYAHGPPSAVQDRLHTLRSLADEDFYDGAVFEHENVARPPRFALRLGNECYPHMKLVIERSPDGRHWFFRADTHDQHCCPAPGSRDYRIFSQLMERNRQVAHKIESAWESAGLLTFRSFLKDDLARRRASPPA